MFEINDHYDEDPVMYAYIPDTDTILEYDECTGIKNKDKWHDEICKRRRFVGTGFIMSYDIFGNLHVGTELHLIYVNK